MEVPPEDLLTEARLLVAECQSLRKQAAGERAKAEAIRLDIRTLVAINRERRAQQGKHRPSEADTTGASGSPAAKESDLSIKG